METVLEALLALQAHDLVIHGLEERLAALISGREEPDLAFVLGVLSAFEGGPCIYGLVRGVRSRRSASEVSS